MYNGMKMEIMFLNKCIYISSTFLRDTTGRDILKYIYLYEHIYVGIFIIYFYIYT